MVPAGAGSFMAGTDVRGQEKLVRTNSGVPLANLNSIAGSAPLILRHLQAETKLTPALEDMQDAGAREVHDSLAGERRSLATV